MSRKLGSLIRTEAKHHILVRWSHWCNIPLLIGLITTGISIYWASPVYFHQPDAVSGNTDYLADIGIWLSAHIHLSRDYPAPADWIYNHFSLGPAVLAQALRLHWMFAYLFVLNGLLYIIGLLLGGGWRDLRLRASDLREGLAVARHYAISAVSLGPNRSAHPKQRNKYNALQRAAYFSVGAAGLLAVLSGWAIHKPVQLGWLTALFGGYDGARKWHFWLMMFFVAFTIPHVLMVVADGWDTFRSMMTGWSERVNDHGQ